MGIKSFSVWLKLGVLVQDSTQKQVLTVLKWRRRNSVFGGFEDATKSLQEL